MLTLSLKWFLKLGFRLLILSRAFRILAWIFARSIYEVKPDGTRVKFNFHLDNRLKMLFLSPSEFRGDPAAFAWLDNVCALELPDVWLSRLMFMFYSPNVERKLIKRYLQPASDDPCSVAKAKYRNFLKKFLPVFYAMTGIQCVISHHILYIADNDWGDVSDSLGVPYFVVHREGVSGGRESYEYVRFEKYLKEFQDFRFRGTRFFVQNNLVASLFTDGGIVAPDQSTTVGTMRMDAFLKRVRDNTNFTRKKRLVYFPFVIGGTTLEDDVYPTFNKSLEIIVSVALKRPDVDVIIKPKGPERWNRQFREDADVAFQQAGIQPDKIPNLTIRWDLDPQDTILESDVISGLNSTTLLEAGVAGKAVVIPYFGILRNHKYDDRIYLREELHNFDVGETEEQFEELLLAKLDNPEVPQPVLEKRKEMFARLVSSTDGNATEKTANLMQKYVNEANIARSTR
jgi:hypothetical protein